MSTAIHPISLKRGRRWTIGRISTDLAIIMVAVPIGLRMLAPPVRGECGTTLDNFALSVGLWILSARLAWVPLKALNAASDRWLTGLTDPTYGPKTQPLDDF